MTTATNYRVMTDAELIDEALNSDLDSLAYHLALRVNNLQIQNGYIDDSDYFAQFTPCQDCDYSENEADQAKQELSDLLDAVRNNDQESIDAILRMNEVQP